MKTNRFLAGILTSGLLTASLHADVLPPVQDSSSLKGKLTLVTGRAPTLPVTGARKGFVFFNLNSLPVDVQAGDIANARLRVYFPSVRTAGDVNVHSVTAGWTEATASAEPGISASPIAMFPAGTVASKKFVEVDVTATVQAWRSGAETNNGFAFVASGLTNLAIGAKEGSGTGYPCELEVQVDRSSSVDFSGTLVGDVAGTQVTTMVNQVGGSSAANIHSAELLANAATNANTDGTLVKRDATGVALPFLRTVATMNGPSFLSANIIAGSTANVMAPGVTGSVIAGGGATNGFPQTINAFYSNIGGGYSNTIGVNGSQSSIAGGVGNSANAGSVAIGGGQSNTGGANFATIAGGQNNTASGANSAIPGGASNTASGTNSFAAGNGNNASGASSFAAGANNAASAANAFAMGRRAKAVHPGAFVWGDSTDADIASTANDQMTIRANGGVALAVNANNNFSVPVGTLYRDNTVVAWGRVSGNGTVSDGFNIASVVRNSAGNYTVTLNTSFSGTALVPVVSVSYIGAQPTTAAAFRTASVNQLLSNTAFGVFINNGNFAAADADFTFIVTGR
jgi:hypothetical protein